MLRTNFRKHATITTPDGRMNGVKNLGYILRNWQHVVKLEWRSLPPSVGYPMQPDGVFTAILRDGRVYRIEYQCFEIWCAFVQRPVFIGLECAIDGSLTKVAKGKEWRDNASALRRK